MSRFLLVTVGTSLFTSASWAPERLSGFGLQRYEEWTKGEKLIDPKARDRDPRVRPLMERAVLESVQPGTDELDPVWVDALPDELQRGEPNKTDAMRYSAELATLIHLAERRKETLRELLAGYDRIALPIEGIRATGDQERDKSAIAGIHLKHYLERILGGGEGDAGERIELWRIEELTSTEPADLTAALERLAERTVEQCRSVDAFDLVVTGGYKIYGFYLAPLVLTAGGGPRPVDGALHYVHERGAALVSLEGETIRVDGAKAPLPMSSPF